MASSEEKSRKPRKHNFSLSEINILTEKVEENLEVFQSKLTNSITNKRKKTNLGEYNRCSERRRFWEVRSLWGQTEMEKLLTITKRRGKLEAIGLRVLRRRSSARTSVMYWIASRPNLYSELLIRGHWNWQCLRVLWTAWVFAVVV